MSGLIVAYVPVIHRGYLDYLASTGVKTLYAIEARDVPTFPQLVREIRALTVVELTTILAPLGYTVYPFSEFKESDLPQGVRIFMPEDDITRSLSFNHEIVWGSWALRWDWTRSTVTGIVQPDADRVIKKGDSDYGVCSERMKLLLKEAQKSTDWWRQVAAMAITASGHCIVAYNKHYPHENVAYMDGDPRDNFDPGKFIEISVSFHAEQGVIAEAARLGISLLGAELYVTVFPCNQCAPPVRESGFRSVYFSGGYSNLYGQRTLREGNVELIYVE